VAAFDVQALHARREVEDQRQLGEERAEESRWFDAIACVTAGEAAIAGRHHGRHQPRPTHIQPYTARKNRGDPFGQRGGGR